jgi:anti-anti-sigma regulatory factor
MSAADPSGGNVVQLPGPATLYESNEIREHLLASLQEGGDLVFDLETSGPWDLSGLQLLVAVIASGKKAGLSVRFAQVPKSCLEIAERSGLGDWLRELSDSTL